MLILHQNILMKMVFKQLNEETYSLKLIYIKSSYRLLSGFVESTNIYIFFSTRGDLEHILSFWF